MTKTKLSLSLSLGLLLGASAAFAADNIYTAPSFFDENGGYFGPDCDQTNYSGAYYTGDYTSPFKTFLGKTDAEIQEKMDQLWNHYFRATTTPRSTTITATKPTSRTSTTMTSVPKACPTV